MSDSEQRKADVNDSAWLILSRKYSNGIAVWWRDGQRGYTNDVQNAGRYSEDHARRILTSCPDDVRIVPERTLESLAKRLTVDIGDADNYKTLMAQSVAAQPGV